MKPIRDEFSTLPLKEYGENQRNVGKKQINVYLSYSNENECSNEMSMSVRDALRSSAYPIWQVAARLVVRLSKCARSVLDRL